ncbi:MAG: helix-turn-helix transcriptional regulator [Sphingosinicella sp.]|nr:helix-turn-helix transcriptional regulator [Sphingosinicella sp.]
MSGLVRECTDAHPLNLSTGLREAGHHRITTHASSLLLVEDVAASPLHAPVSGYELNHQIVLPYLGLFGYSLGNRTQLFDSNRTLFVAPNREFRDSHPIADLGHASIIITPRVEILDEICGTGGAREHSAFRQGARAASRELQLLTHRLRRLADGEHTVLQRDEWTIRALREALDRDHRREVTSSKVVDRAKQALHARGCERISLGEVAREVGVSPIYLTQEFSRAEGVPLYRYQLNLRLSRALMELRDCNDITVLALDLGFSSHSHFSFTFKKAFGLTPSDYRRSEVLPR